METYFAVCAGLAVLALWILVIAGVATLLAFYKTAQSVDKLTQKLDERADALKSVTDILETVAEALRSTWFRSASVIFDVLGGIRRAKKYKEKESET